jgi:hypothetical protein
VTKSCAQDNALLAREPELRAEFTRLEADARVAKDALPLVNAMRETKGAICQVLVNIVVGPR